MTSLSTGLSSANASITTLNADANGAGIKYFRTNSTLADGAATGLNSVAVGPAAVATNAGDVALGYGSTTSAAVATTGVTLRGTAYSYAGASPVSTVSIGAPGAERTLTNLAAGQVTATSTDAVNGSQLYATDQAVNSLTSGTAGAFVADNRSGGPNPTASGAGSVAGGFGANASGANSTVIGGGSSDGGNAGATVIGQGAGVAPSTAGSNIALGQGSTVTSAPVSTAGAAIGGTVYSGFAGAMARGTVSLGSAGQERTLTNLAAGQVTATSTDAINGSELYSVASAGQTAVAALSASTSAGLSSTNSGIAYLSTGLSSVTASIITLEAQQTTTGAGSTAMGTGATAAGTGSMAMGTGATAIGTSAGPALSVGTGNTAIGAGSVAMGDPNIALGMGTVAIGSNNTATGTATEAALAMGSGNTATGAGAVALGDPNVALGIGAVAIGANNTAIGDGSVAVGNISSAQGAGSVALGNNAIANNAGDVALGSGSVTGLAAPVAAVDLLGVRSVFAGANPTSVVSVGAPGAERQITNVAAGQITAISTDAVNGSELYATNQAVTTLGATVASLGSGASAASSAVAVQAAAATAAVASLSTSVATGTTGLVQQQGGAPGNGAITVGAQTGGTSFNIAGTSGARVLSGVAAGVAATDAVDVGQLEAALTGAGANAVQYDSAAHNSVTLGAVGANPVALNNIAAGALTATSTQAVNGAQLYSANSNITNLQNGASGPFQVYQSGTVTAPVASGLQSTAGGDGAIATGGAATAIGYRATASGVNSVALGANSSDGGVANVVSIGSPGYERRLTNVAPGVNGTDAVNMNQLTGVANYATALNSALRVRVDSQMAAANALSSLAFATAPGKGMISAGFGAQQGQAALAIGMSHQFKDRYNTIIRGGATFGTGGAGTGLNGSINLQF